MINRLIFSMIVPKDTKCNENIGGKYITPLLTGDRPLIYRSIIHCKKKNEAVIGPVLKELQDESIYDLDKTY